VGTRNQPTREECYGGGPETKLRGALENATSLRTQEGERELNEGGKGGIGPNAKPKCHERRGEI